MAIGFVLFGVDLDFLVGFDCSSPETDRGDYENSRYVQPVKLPACVTVTGAQHDFQPVW
jgi:hypothetical protein